MNIKSFHGMHIMQELPTNKTNFLFKNTQDVNLTRHAAPHFPIIFIDNIILYFNYLTFVLHVFKWSCNAHITFFSNTSKCMLIKPQKFLCKKKPWIFISTLVINTRLFTTLKNVDMFKIIQFYWLMHSAFCHWKHFEIFITCSLEDGFVHGARFSKWRQIQNIAKCKYLFPSILP